MVLDEAQYIKNPLTQVARAAKRLPAGVRFALTGTPIETACPSSGASSTF